MTRSVRLKTLTGFLFPPRYSSRKLDAFQFNSNLKGSSAVFCTVYTNVLYIPIYKYCFPFEGGNARFPLPVPLFLETETRKKVFMSKLYVTLGSCHVVLRRILNHESVLSIFFRREDTATFAWTPTIKTDSVWARGGSLLPIGKTGSIALIQFCCCTHE